MDVVHLNVGGVFFYTTRTTLNLCESTLKSIVNARPDEVEFFIDRDPSLFRYILNWLRGVPCLPMEPHLREELWYEADFYGILEMGARLS